ncbi:DUF1090 domain-containing protein [Polaromonas sp. SM01]|uniref:DUF1090 domain-containing protein n=1 Tax=Polaromonas sp. SM01 TaxID=3085630 RepID=UPI0029815756|nr:DUF1090 domain-containing protein [Polaromonas sp. SM01]MDW5443258.1 DUF1090 domain-containing protein [Polaromonas sp. SM01]
MKQLILASVLVLAVAPLWAQQPSAACEAQRARIEAQIERAQAAGNSREVAGLQKALRANKAHCSDASLAAERERNIRKATKKVAEREKDLAEAQRKGDPDKIAQRQRKLDEARQALAEAQKPLLP